MNYEYLHRVHPDVGLNQFIQELVNVGWELVSHSFKPNSKEGNMSLVFRMPIEEDPKRYGTLVINQFVANYFDLDPIWLKTPGKDRDKSRPRMIASYVMHHFGKTNKEICAEYSQDHSNVTAAIKRVKELMAENIYIAASVKEIIRKLKAPGPLIFKTDEGTA